MSPLPAGTPDGDERLPLVINEVGEVILGPKGRRLSGPVLSKPGWDSRGVQQVIMRKEGVNTQHGEFVFPARSTLADFGEPINSSVHTPNDIGIKMGYAPGAVDWFAEVCQG